MPLPTSAFRRTHNFTPGAFFATLAASSVQNATLKTALQKRVLIVDDDEEICDALADLLRDEGYLVEVAANGGKALDALASMPMDAILLDLSMPVMNGYEFLEHRAADPELAKTPVIVMSASASAIEPAPLTSVLGKPIDIEALLAILRLCSPSSVDDPSG